MYTDNEIYDLIIIGGGGAGLTAGIYAGRAKLKTLLFEKQQIGGQATITDVIANYPGFQNVTGPELMEKMAEQAKDFGTEILYQDVKRVDLTKEVKEIYTDTGIYKSRTVIIATGASPKQLGFEGENEFRGRGVGYCATCDGFFFSGKEIFVIGGGYSAAEEGLYLTRFGKKVTIVVRKDAFDCAKSLVDEVMGHPKIEVLFHTELMKVYGDQVLKGAVFFNNETNETWTYTAPEEDGTFGVFIFIGYKPATALFEGQLELDAQGYIVTDDKMQSSLPGVFAAGDLRPKALRQLVTATADGAIAAMQAEKYLEEINKAALLR